MWLNSIFEIKHINPGLKELWIRKVVQWINLKDVLFRFECFVDDNSFCFSLFSLRDVTLDIAEDRNTRQDRANPVEQCVCPVGYRGLSCEDCDTGFTRSGGGLYLGLCEPCQCNGHSNECDPETGVCRVREILFWQFSFT